MPTTTNRGKSEAYNVVVNVLGENFIQLSDEHVHLRHKLDQALCHTVR